MEAPSAINHATNWRHCQIGVRVKLALDEMRCDYRIEGELYILLYGVES